MLRASASGSDRSRQPASPLQPLEPADRNISSAEKRPGPTKGTSWKEVEPLEGQLASEGSAHSISLELNETSDTELREIRIKDLDSGREYNVPQVCKRLHSTMLPLT